jgi:hypothetical protein
MSSIKQRLRKLEAESDTNSETPVLTDEKRAVS